MFIRSLTITCALATGLASSMSYGALAVTNGDFEAQGPAANVADVSGWFDSTATNFWEQTWVSNAQTNGTNAVIFSSIETATFGSPTPDANDGGFLYQEIGTADGQNNLTVNFDFGAPTDDPGGRVLGMTVGIYAYDGVGAFTAADGTDVRGAAGVTLLDSSSFIINGTTAGGQQGSYSAFLSLAGAGSQTLFLRFNNYLPTAGDSWPTLDNVSISAVPEPSSYALITGFLSLAAMAYRRRKSA